MDRYERMERQAKLLQSMREENNRIEQDCEDRKRREFIAKMAIEFIKHRREYDFKHAFTSIYESVYPAKEQEGAK